MIPMKSIISRTGLFTILCIGMVYLTIPSQLNAQIVDPFREYTNPDEIVAFNKSTTYNEAIEIINTFAQEYENKFIVDNSGYSGQIGVNLPAMHWKDALQYIMRFQNLELTDHGEFYEITVKRQAPGTGSEANQTAQTGQTTGQGQTLLATTQTREIRINATFFEGNKRALQEIGIDWSTLTSDIPENLGDFVSGEGGETVPQTQLQDQFVSVNSYNAANVSQNAFNAMVNLGEVGPGISVQALFRAFEADNLGKVLATPSIKVVDGQEGNIQVGQDFSIKQRDIAGNVTDNFQSTGTILNVVPHIISQGDTSFIYLELEVERSTAQPDVVSTIINKQEATTSAILLDGEATYVAGLYRTEEATVRRGIPILKDLPGWFFGLRYLFGYNSKDYTENELVIIVQAELIEPVSKRINRKLLTKREVLNDTRDQMRSDLDRVFEKEEPTVEEELTDSEPEIQDTIPQPQVVDTVYIEREPEPVVEDTAETETEEELTEEQLETAEELSMPVDKPELMVVVPKAFNLDEYLEYQQNGEGEKVADKYFIIGASFLVPKNADNFKAMLDAEGYNTRILFHPESRFNYVAYEGYTDFEKAVERTLEIRDSFNSEAWLFTLRNGNGN